MLASPNPSLRTAGSLADARADSPMRKSPGAVEDSPAPPPTTTTTTTTTGSAPHGLPTPHNELAAPAAAAPPAAPPQPLGFTAVNGETRRNTSFRPDDSAAPRPPVSPSDEKVAAHANGKPATTAPKESDARPQERRPDGRETASTTMTTTTTTTTTSPIATVDAAAPTTETASHKRKRSDSPARETREAPNAHGHAGSRPDSPKRRATTAEVSTVSPRSTGTRDHSPERERRTIELSLGSSGYARAHSPTERWDRGEPPPAPRKDIAASLAESVQREFSTAKESDAAHSSQQPEDSSPIEDKQFSTEPTGPDDGTDQKKRKRQFSNRTKTGCHTCRSRKKKCDETKPICENCKRGNFECAGYGPKPNNVNMVGGMKAIRHVNLQPSHQSHHHYEVKPVPYGHAPDAPPSRHFQQPWPPAGSEPPPPHRFSGGPPPRDHRSNSGHEPWHRGGPPPPPWPGADPHGLPHYPPTRPPQHEYQPPPPPPLPAAPYVPEHHRGPPPPAPPSVGEQWSHPGSLPHYRHSNGPGTVVSTRASVSTGSDHRPPPRTMHYVQRGEWTEREKMVTGRPYRHFTDGLLLQDREACMRAVRSYNESAYMPGSHTVAKEREGLFRKIIHPIVRGIPYVGGEWHGPSGSVGTRTIVESPFHCDYGYNIHIGDDVAISPNCQFQDACKIEIGARSIIGPNVKLYCMSASVIASKRTGSQGEFIAGAIRIGEDCFIGADAIIMPYRTIGRGAVVAAGSVVTRDVPPNTIVAGNPAKRVRELPSGLTDDRSTRRDIQEQNDAMVRSMQNDVYTAPGYSRR